VRLPDVNLLFHAVDADSPRHEAARRWLGDRLSGTEQVGLAWITLTSFLRLSTRAPILASPLKPRQALDIVDGWLARPIVSVLEPTRRHWEVLRGLIEHVGTAGNLVTDAHLAALAIEHGATLESADHDFGRFPGLRWEDPLMVSPPQRPRQSRKR
jgi:toxin-antitoxin system PIN domain toxin